MGNWRVLSTGGGGAGELKATFNLGVGGAQYVGDDLTPHVRVEHGGEVYLACANAAAPPTVASLYLEVEVSRDNCDTWDYIFATPGTADAAKVVVPVGEFGVCEQASFAEGHTTLVQGDVLRCNLLAGSGVDGEQIMLVIYWR